jgi:hypothetical protein
MDAVPPDRLGRADRPATGRLVAGLLERRPHPEQGYRACLGLMRLGRQYGADRLEAACRRAEHLQSYRYRTVEHILQSQQDRLPLDQGNSTFSSELPARRTREPKPVSADNSVLVATIDVGAEDGIAY